MHRLFPLTFLSASPRKDIPLSAFNCESISPLRDLAFGGFVVGASGCICECVFVFLSGRTLFLLAAENPVSFGTCLSAQFDPIPNPRNSHARALDNVGDQLPSLGQVLAVLIKCHTAGRLHSTTWSNPLLGSDLVKRLKRLGNQAQKTKTQKWSVLDHPLYHHAALCNARQSYHRPLPPTYIP